MKRSPATEFAVLIQRFFTEYLTEQKNVSPRTVAAYRDTFRLFIGYMQTRQKKLPTQLKLADFSGANLLGFLDHLEKVRHNTIRTRNARWAAIRAFLHYAIACQAPVGVSEAQRALAIPLKRYPRKILGFLSREEMDAILKAPSENNWSGRRDHVLFRCYYNTGARVSELLQVRVDHVRNDGSVQLIGKGRKERTIPLWKSTHRLIRNWSRQENLNSNDLLFTNRLGSPLSRSGVAHRLKLAVQKAAETCESLRDKHISPHTFRHTTAMHLLQGGIAPEVIALWLGHESPATTHLYVEADLSLKEKALESIQSPKARTLKFKPKDALLQFLDQL